MVRTGRTHAPKQQYSEAPVSFKELSYLCQRTSSEDWLHARIPWLVCTEDIAALADLVSAQPRVLNEQDRIYKCAALHVAVISNKNTMLLWLLSQKRVNVNIKCKWGSTPLLLAVRQGDIDMISTLRENGASPGCICHDDTTIWHHVIDCDSIETARFLAKCSWAHPFLDSKAAGNTPLIMACKSRAPNARSIAELLITIGADLMIEDNLGRTAVELAVDSSIRTLLQDRMSTYLRLPIRSQHLKDVVLPDNTIITDHKSLPKKSVSSQSISCYTRADGACILSKTKQSDFTGVSTPSAPPSVYVSKVTHKSISVCCMPEIGEKLSIVKAWAVNIKCDESNVTTRIFAMEPQAVSTAGSPKALTAALADLQAGVRYLVQCRYVSIAADDIIVSMVMLSY